MCADWIGCRVSLDCGGLGHFQGIISSVDLSDHSITLKDPFQNGVPCKVKQTTLRGNDILDLTILEKKSEIEASRAKSAEADQSTVLEVKKPKTRQNVKRQISKEQKNYDSDGAGYGGATSGMDTKKSGNGGREVGFQPLMSLMLEKQGFRASPKKEVRSRTPNNRNAAMGATTPNKRDRFRKDEDCFSPSVFDMNEEFDFEKNLAMFDKEGVMAEIDQKLSNKPDIIRLVDCNIRKPEPKYRHDENVLGNQVMNCRQIETGEVMETEYSTDAGLIVPAISLSMRERLLNVLSDHGFDISKQAELMGRAATDLCLQLLGGAHRLAANNAHQLPLAVILCGASKSAVYGLSTARHLAGHGVRTQVYLPETMGRHQSPQLEQELRLYRLTGGKVVTKAKDLPSISVDAVVNALEDEEMCFQQRIQPWHRGAVAWAQNLKAPVLAIDPPPEIPVLVPRRSLVGLLPLAQPAQCGQLFLANLGVPKNLFKELGIKYTSPFGSKFVIPLYPCS